jgi:DNA-binding CsgD family transcriptional regulator
MLNWKEIVQNYIIKNSDKIKKVTRPLRDHLGVAYFTYHQIDKNGKYTVLVDRPDWAEHYVEEKFFLEDPYLRHPDVYESGFSLIESHGSDHYKKTVMKAGKEIFNLDFGLIMVEKQADKVEFFGFAGNRTESNLDKLYLNKPALLKSFARHFKKELGPILHEMEQEAGLLSKLKGADFYLNDPIHPDLEAKDRLAYLFDLGLKPLVKKAHSLSSRERDCLKWLLAGKSAKETAQLLNLSTRTVESYFENIKNKLSCPTKHEIFALAKSFDELGLLP